MGGGPLTLDRTLCCDLAWERFVKSQGTPYSSQSSRVGCATVNQTLSPCKPKVSWDAGLCDGGPFRELGVKICQIGLRSAAEHGSGVSGGVFDIHPVRCGGDLAINAAFLKPAAAAAASRFARGSPRTETVLPASIDVSAGAPQHRGAPGDRFPSRQCSGRHTRRSRNLTPSHGLSLGAGASWLCAGPLSKRSGVDFPLSGLQIARIVRLRRGMPRRSL
jgi:hypothetical protein